MDKRNWFGCLGVLLAVPFLVVARVSRLPAQGPSADKGSAAVLRHSLDELKQRVLADNKLLHLAALNVQSKGYAVRVSQANYFPQIVGTSVYFHFNDDLGTVLTRQGRTVQGPRGVPLKTFPSTTINLPVLNQDNALNMITVTQPITDLLSSQGS